MIGRALRDGSGAAARRFRITLLIYLLNLAAALLVAAPMAALLDEAIGRSPAAGGLETHFSLEVLVDLLAARAAGFDAQFTILGVAALAFILISTLVTGGILDSLNSPPRSPFLPRFFGGAGRLAFRYLRLLPYLALVLAGIAALGRGLDHLIAIGFDQSTLEAAAFWAMRGKQALILVLLLGAGAVFDLARILTAVENRTHMIGALLTAANFVARHLPAVLAIAAASMVLSIAAFAPYLIVTRHLPGGTLFVPLLIAQQGVLIVRHWIRVSAFATLLAYYRLATGAHPGAAPAADTADDLAAGDTSREGGLARGLATAGILAGLVALPAILIVIPAAAAPAAATPATTTPAPIAAPPAAPAAAGPPTATPPLARRVVDYRIDATLDPDRRAVTGRATIDYRNDASRPMGDLQMHLYMNAFSNDRSLWMRTLPWDDENFRRKLDRLRADGSWGSIHVRSLRAGGVDLTSAARVDETVLVAPLPVPVPPGRMIRLEVEWETVLPRTFHRTGQWGDHYDVTHWFPKPGVWTDTGWKMYPFSRYTEFFADYGRFEVAITAPSRFQIEATGIPAAPVDHADGTRTVTWTAGDVHDFAWIADAHAGRARLLVAEGPYASSPVEVIYFHQPAHGGMARRILETARHGLVFHGGKFGPYPYRRLVIDDLPMGLSSGMEYPMLFTVSVAGFVPVFLAAPEELTLHEFGHQHWYGLVATNEFEEAWLDEGINTYVTGRAMESMRPAPKGGTVDALFHYAAVRVADEGLELRLPGAVLDLDMLFGFAATPLKPHTGGFVGYPLSPFDLRLPGFHDALLQSSRSGYAAVARDNALATPSWEFLPGSYAGTVYDKTCVVLETLARLIGRETIDAALADYVRRHRFGHPTGDDLLAAIRRAAGAARPGLDLTPWFDTLVHGTGLVDYAVTSIASRPLPPARGLLPADRAGLPPVDRRFPPAGSDADDPGLFETEVVVRRLGDAVLPVDILVRFQDGHEVRDTWDGRATWWRRTWERPARIERARVDPDGILAVDIDRTNNGRLLDPDRRPVIRLAQQWLFWVQNYLLLAVALV
jgi:hypothetical protein